LFKDAVGWALHLRVAYGAMSYRPPVLVTGSHRSGSTFVGKMLSLSPSLGYIREPFSVVHRRGVLDVPFPRWFPYICPENEDPYLRPVEEMLEFRFKGAAALRTARTPRDIALAVHDAREFARFRRRGARPLLKDPIAVFSAGWLADTFGAQPVVLIRHPAAFASSLMKYGWTHPFDDFLQQPLLMRDLLSPFSDQIAAFARTQEPIIDQAILLWMLIHHAVLRYRDTRPTWRSFRHEDLARDPLGQFGEMFAYLQVAFGDREREGILAATDPSNPSEAAAGAIKRDSRSAAVSWKTRLSQQEIDHIREGTREIAGEFYSDDEW
jgi:sulfotransferase family protein